MKQQIPIFSSKESIIKLIASGDLESAIKESREFTKHQSPQAFKNITILSCRYNILWREVIEGVASSDEKERVVNKIAVGLYDIITKVPNAS